MCAKGQDFAPGGVWVIGSVKRTRKLVWFATNLLSRKSKDVTPCVRSLALLNIARLLRLEERATKRDSNKCVDAGKLSTLRHLCNANTAQSVALFFIPTPASGRVMATISFLSAHVAGLNSAS